VLSLVALLTLAAPAAAAEEPSLRSLERLPLPPGALSLRAEPLEMRLALLGARDAQGLAGTLRALGSAICPRVEARAGEVILGCRTRRLAARILSSEAGATLELRDLVGLPGGGPEGFPSPAFDVAALGWGSCPGATAAARGECLLAAGLPDEARAAFEEAGEAEARGPAALRLGDLAMRQGDQAAAAARWRAVTDPPWLRLAAARLCELGSCASSAEADEAFRADGLPPPLAADVTLRGLRALAFRGQFGAAARGLCAAGLRKAAGGLCEAALFAALRGPPAHGSQGLVAYVALADRQAVPRALELARLAAARAEEAGAPAFGAALLTAAGSGVSERDLPEHLLRTAELYLAAGDAVRAGVIADYAHARLRGRIGGARWGSVDRATQAARRGRGGAAKDAAAPPVDDIDLLAASAALARARARPSREAP